MNDQKKAILVVSFGTSHEDTRIRSIDSIENKIRIAFPEYIFYRAWTSPTIRRILKKREGISIDSIQEALEKIKNDGIREVIVQPTLVINGYEQEEIQKTVSEYKNAFDSITVGKPLLSSKEDMDIIVDMLGKQWKDVPKGEAVVLMGHGTEHYVNTVYAALDYQLKENGYSNIHVGTVEAYPSIDTVKRCIQRNRPEKVHLCPFMIVAGDHAKNDMAGEEDDSWRAQIEQMGYSVECHLKGLGELDTVQNLFVEHVREL